MDGNCCICPDDLPVHSFQITLTQIRQTAEQAGADNLPHFIGSHINQNRIKAVGSNPQRLSIHVLLKIPFLFADNLRADFN